MDYSLRMRPEDWIRERAALLKAAAQWRDPGADAVRASGAGSCRVDARSNDYLGLARSVVSRETVEPAVQAGSGASRLISGTLAEHLELEARLAEWLGTESALLFSTGYAANVGTISALAGPGDVVFSDVLNHASLIDGCRLGRARVEVVPHLDLAALERGLAAAAPTGARWVVTESYFGMDGDVPDLRALRRLCDEYGAGLVVDEAHALGVFGAEGRGLCAEAGVAPDLLIGGMGKGLGVQGGFVAGSSTFRAWLWNRARTFVYSTAPSPLLCRLALQQLARLRGAEAARERLRKLEARLVKALQHGGVVLAPGRRGPLFPMILGSELATLEASAALAAQGIGCHAIRPPTVPAGASRLRVTLRADMTEEQIEYLATGLLEAWRSTQGPSGLTPAESATCLIAAPPPPLGSPPAEEPGPTNGRGGGVAAAVAVAQSGQKARRWIVFGTGTGVGKSFVAEALVRMLAARGVPVAGLKPVETGLGVAAGEGALASDAARLERASFHVKHPLPHPLFGFPEPLAPSLAARRASSAIELDRVRPWLERLQPDGTDQEPTLVIETAGGVFSPLSDSQNNLDLAVALGPAEWILVAPDRLGALHEVLSTLRAMQSEHRAPDWVVLSAFGAADASTGTNASELRRRNITAPILELGHGQTSALEALLPHYPQPPAP